MATAEDKSVKPMAWAEVDLGALTHNIKTIRERLQKGTLFCAVVKKNAYGHGVIPVARHALSAGADYLAVYSLEEGIELRRAGISAPILIFRRIPPEEAHLAVEHRLIPTVMDMESATSFNNIAGQSNKTLQVHVKVDTGLNRSGVNLEDTAAFISSLSRLGHLKVEGLYTHFASADEPDTAPTELQLKRLLDVARSFPDITLLHAANSAATLRFPQAHLGMVRVGISLYGLYPSRDVKWDVTLKPLLSLKAPILRIHRLKADDGVGYGLTWKAPGDALVALVPLGYGDGLPRLLSNNGEALVRGHRAPIRGRVSMDQTVIDITDIPGVEVGDIVNFIGKQPPEEISADDVAARAQTINYEIVTTLPSRLPRMYV